MKAFKRVLPILVWLVVSMPSVSSAAFSRMDLSGTWDFYVFFDHPGIDDPGWRRGAVTFNSSGAITAGSLTDNETTTVSISSGSLAVNNVGFLSGIIVSSNGVTSTFSHGKMDKGKNLISFVGTDNQGYRFKGSAIKAGGAFATADVAGTWHFHSFLGDPGADTAGWTGGTVIANVSGNITGGSFTNDVGLNDNVTGGSIPINSSGVFSGTINFSSGLVVTLSQGKLDAGKTTAAFVGTDNTGFVFAGQAIKAGGVFSIADLAGRWQFHTFWDYPLANAAGMEHGTVIVNSSGAITGGTVFFDTESSPDSVSGGTLTIDGAGVLSGNIQYFGGAFVETISHGKMSGSKTVVSFVGTDSDGFVFQGTALKIGGGVNDFDDDGQTDIAVYRNGSWFIQNSNGATTVVGWGGAAQDLPVPADYDGDGNTDIAIYRSGAWYIMNSSGGTQAVGWGGAAQDVPVPADYDGDGKTDIAMYRSGAWYIMKSSGGTQAVGWGGAAQDVPVPADYDGDGKTDIAIYRSGAWYIMKSSGGTQAVGWGGAAQDVPVPADYDGDGKTDIAIYRSGAWYIMKSSGGTQAVGWGGAAQDIPVPADYDGDGKADVAVFRDGVWHIVKSSAGTESVSWGTTGDVPIN